MKRGGNSKQQIALTVQLFDEKNASGVSVPEEIHVLPTGTFKHPYYGEFSITSADITRFVENFRAGIRNDLRITEGHDNGMSGGELPAIAWFKELRDAGVQGLYATVDWTERGKQLLQDKAFKYFSAELYMKYVDPQTEEERDCVLVGGALTNSPYFRQLKPVIASFAFSETATLHFNTNETSNMDLATLLAKKKEDLSAEEKAFIKENKGQLTDEQKESHKEIVDDAPAETPEQKQAREEKETGDANEAAGLNRDGSAKIDASEHAGKVMISASELAELRTKADAGHQALEKLNASERKATIAQLTFSSTNKDGRFLPAQGVELEKFLVTLSETQRTQFTALVAGMPKTSMFKELGKSESGVQLKASEEVAQAVKAKMIAEPKLKYSDALRQVFKEKPELSKLYNEEMGVSVSDEE